MVLLFSLLGLLLSLFIIWRIYFLRNPPRTIPTGSVLVAPADGFVVYIKPVQQGEVPIAIKQHKVIPLAEITEVSAFNGSSGVLIGIFMTPLSVHRNRAPMAGKIVLNHYYQNKINLSMIRTLVETLFRFKRFTDNEFYLTNERLTLGIETAKGTLYITQIADEWINRIVSWVKVGDAVARGEQYGMIRFGSQCDLFIPDSFAVTMQVKVGDYVHAGSSVLATYQESTAP